MQSFCTEYWRQRNWSANFYIDEFTIILHSIPFPYGKLQDLSIDALQYNFSNAVNWSAVHCLTYKTAAVISPPLLQAITETFKNLTTLVFDSQVDLSYSNVILHNVKSLQLNSPMKKTFLKSIFSITPNVKILKMDGTQLLAYTPRLPLTSLHVMGASMSQFHGYIVNYPALEIAMSGKFYHDDPDRDHNFWVYPRNKALVTPRWDTYNVDDLCDNDTLLGQDG
ncbi:unnamed protein product [Rotaria sp. Silwood1]|nr:unnamed protein product [Rotaria sp. Silwood1]CAF4758442.1 unnamed protein product [Rotaria sp. Silwood1]